MPSKDSDWIDSPAAACDESALLGEIIETQNDLAALELDPQVVTRMVAQRVQKLTRADGAVVDMLEGDWLVCHAGCGIMQPHNGRKFSRSHSLAGHALRTNSFQYSDDVENDPRVDRDACRKIGVRSMVVVPLCTGAQPIGVLVVLWKRPGAFDKKVISALRLIAGIVTASLSHAAEFEIKKKLLAERTGALAALRQSEQRFHNAFEHAAVGMALVGLDGRWLQVNSALCRIVGYTRTELLATDFQSITLPQDLDADLIHVGQLVRGEIADYQMVKRYIHRQGHLVWVLLSVSVLRDDGGKPLYFIAQIQDITQRHMAEDALRASEEQHRATFELAGVGKAQVDLASGRFIRVNQKFCEITGYSADELRCLSFAGISHPDDVEASRQAARRMTRGQIADYSVEKRYIRKDGQVIWISLNAAVLKDSQGRATRAVATVLDITDRKRAESLEHDRRTVLEMVAQHMPLPEVLARLAGAVERQIDGGTAAVMLLDAGKIAIHGAGLPATLRSQLEARSLPTAAELSQGAWTSPDSCGITDLRTDSVWQDFRAAAADADLATCWTTAVQSADATPLGLLLVFCRRSRRPTSAELQMLRTAGRLATICVEHHQTALQLSHLVRHDALTGLPNRLLFQDRMQQALALARRSGKSVGLMVLDIDRFKTVNDTLGHHAGDHLLQQFAQRIQSRLRETDTFARLGGDEFAIVLPELDQPEAAASVAQKILAALTEPFTIGGNVLHATASIGIALFPQNGEDPVTLQQHADDALYQVKFQGRNAFAFHTP